MFQLVGRSNLNRTVNLLILIGNYPFNIFVEYLLEYQWFQRVVEVQISLSLIMSCLSAMMLSDLLIPFILLSTSLRASVSSPSKGG